MILRLYLALATKITLMVGTFFGHSDQNTSSVAQNLFSFSNFSSLKSNGSLN